MGIVYKAADTKLKRNVALKFPPSELTRDKKAQARFIQEAQAAAAINHPHICTVYEVDESDDQTFIAMEFIEGQALKDKIKAGPLDVNEAIDIASQVAEGIGQAHKKGIVHRDIKPANIMLTGIGKAKITDFGQAKLSWGAELTKPSMIMGTVAYRVTSHIPDKGQVTVCYYSLYANAQRGKIGKASVVPVALGRIKEERRAFIPVRLRAQAVREWTCRFD
jgi:serine/threonine protein kinase